MPRIFLTFYRNFFVFAGSISLAACIFLSNSKTVSALLILFWMKLITNVLLGFLYTNFNKVGFYFYNNLGFSARQMFAGALLIDMLLWLLLSISILLI